MVLNKAYDKDALLNSLKEQGIQEGEQLAKVVVTILAEWLRESAKMSDTGLVGKFDDFAIPGINYFEKLALEKLNELDGK